MIGDMLEQSNCPVPLPDDAVTLAADLCVPEDAHAVVALCGKDVSRRNFSGLSEIARSLRQAGFATVSLDLLAATEQVDCRHATCLRANFPLLAHRLASATDWLQTCECTRGLPIGYFGSDIGSAVALAAAAQRPADVAAMVSYAGRPLLVLPVLAQVRTPTLLIADEGDPALLKLQHIALAQLNCPHSVAIVSGQQAASLAQVASLACDWFGRYLH